jgi:NAD(P)-dependent dehydrogenase (short-subunit alcohol dehydrogenase family)
MALAVVTGAAGGIGTAVVSALIERGCSVLAVDLNKVDESTMVTSAVADVTDLRAMSDIAQAAGPVNYLITLAGGALREEKDAPDVMDLPIDVIRRTIDLNLIGAFVAMKAFAPNIRSATGDRSITVTSATDSMVSYGFPAYAAAKGGLLGVVHALAGVLGDEGIRINAVAPGDIPTARNVRDWVTRPDWYGRIESDSALGRLCTVDEVGAAFRAVAMELTAMTGQCMVVDAGRVGVHPLATRRDRRSSETN